MSCLRPLLDGYAPRISSELRRNLSGVFGGLIRGYLPQRWVLEVDGAVYTILVDPAGACRILEEAAEPRDVTIRIGHDALRDALRGARPPGAPRPAFAVTFQSPTAETAFKFLHERFGL